MIYYISGSTNELIKQGETNDDTIKSRAGYEIRPYQSGRQRYPMPEFRYSRDGFPF